MKRLFLLAVWALFSLVLSAQPINPSDYSAPVKVACIGNSITYGMGIVDREHDSYPAQLGKMLGENWEVKNFGVSARTLLKKGDYPYWKEDAYQQAKAFLPDVVIIKLGTNDTKPKNWQYANEFYSDYKAMVDELKALPSHPKIFLCKPVPAYAVKWGINDSTIVNGVIPVVEKLAKKEKLTVIDLHQPLSGKEELFPDKIHPNAEGAGIMAKVIYKVLTGKE